MHAAHLPADLTTLARLLSCASGADVTLTAITPLSGGASSDTARLAATCNGVDWPLIWQRTAGGAPVDGAMTKHVQAAVQDIAHQHGLPVARVVLVTAPDDGLGDGYVMEQVAGESLAPRYLGDSGFAVGRSLLGAQTATALARIHQIDPLALAGLGLRAASPAEQVDQLFASYDQFASPNPAFELGFAWAKRMVPTLVPTSPRLVHGDFRSGNFLVDATTGLTAILDWELAHLGDPMEDIGWLCGNSWRFGHWHKPVGGFADRAEFYAAYEAASGQPLDRAALHFWEVFGTLRWGVSCLQLVHQHLSGAVVSIERAAIGRRISEVEIDVLHLLRHGTI